MDIRACDFKSVNGWKHGEWIAGVLHDLMNWPGRFSRTVVFTYFGKVCVIRNDDDRQSSPQFYGGDSDRSVDPKFPTVRPGMPAISYYLLQVSIYTVLIPGLVKRELLLSEMTT